MYGVLGKGLEGNACACARGDLPEEAHGWEREGSCAEWKQLRGEAKALARSKCEEHALLARTQPVGSLSGHGAHQALSLL